MNIRKGKKSNTKPRIKKSPSNMPLRVKQIWVKKKYFLALHNKNLIKFGDVPLDSLMNHLLENLYEPSHQLSTFCSIV